MNTQNSAPQSTALLQTGVKYEPRMTKDRRIVLRPVARAVRFLSNDGIVLALDLPEIDLAQAGAIFIFPPQNNLNLRTAGDPLSSLPPRMGQLLNQSATPLFLFTEFVAYVAATELPQHEGDGPVLDIVEAQQAHIAMRTMQTQATSADQYADSTSQFANNAPAFGRSPEQQRIMAQHAALHRPPGSGPDLTKVFDYAARMGLKEPEAP